MPEITNALLAVAIAVFGVAAVLTCMCCALWSSVNEQHRTNDISERMAKIMEGE